MARPDAVTGFLGNISGVESPIFSVVWPFVYARPSGVREGATPSDIIVRPTKRIHLFQGCDFIF